MRSHGNWLHSGLKVDGYGIDPWRSHGEEWLCSGLQAGGYGSAALDSDNGSQGMPDADAASGGHLLQDGTVGSLQGRRTVPGGGIFVGAGQGMCRRGNRCGRHAETPTRPQSDEAERGSVRRKTDAVPAPARGMGFGVCKSPRPFRAGGGEGAAGAIVGRLDAGFSRELPRWR